MADEEQQNRDIVKLLQEDPVQMDMDFGNLVVVDGIPVVDSAKAEKLEKFMLKRFEKFDAPGFIDCNMFLVDGPKGPTGHGFCILTFANSADALSAVQKVNGKTLDKTHKMSLLLYNDFLRLINVPDVLPEVERDADAEDAAAHLRGSLHDWLLDGQYREQLMLRAGPDCVISWVNPKDTKFPLSSFYSQSEDNEGGSLDQMWADRNAAWSPLGSFVATHHEQGIRLWGGESMLRVAQFRHAQTDLMLFSPKEKFLVTGRTHMIKGSEEPATIVWNTFTEEAVFSMPALARPDPQIRWSHDDKYLALVQEDKIRIFETFDDKLVEQAPIEVAGVNDARFSPDQNVLVFSVPERDNSPCKVTLMSLPSRTVLRDRQLYSVADVSIQWQAPLGDFLSVKMVRSKKGKPSSTSLEIFKLREKDVPVESLNFPEIVHDIQWEPQGRRLAVIHGESDRVVEFFQMQKTKQVKSVFKLEKASALRCFWAPYGSYAALVQTDKGIVEFFDAQNYEVISSQEHFMMNGLSWSPDGQTLLTTCCVSPNEENWRLNTECGYKLWNKFGEPISERKVETCYRLEWRPRPPSPLDAQAQAKLRTQLREKYWKRFEAEDDQLRFQLLGDEEKERQAQREAWKAFRAACAQVFAEERAIRQSRWNEDLEVELINVETVVDSEIDTKTEIVSN